MTPPSTLAPTPRQLADPRRLAAVESLQLTGQHGDPHLDALVETLALACGVPLAVVNLATPGLQTYPAEVGVGSPCTKVPDELSFCVEVVETARPMHVQDATAHPRYSANPLVQDGIIRSYAGVPIAHRGVVVGVLSMFDHVPRSFDAHELDVLQRLAVLAEGILALRAASAWDALTGVAGRPLLVDRLERAVTRASHAGHVAAVVVLDVCGMGEINLRHGSHVGDGVLTVIAERLTAAAVRRDSVARLGGDEFAVILEDLTSVEQARSRAAELADAARGEVVVDGEHLVVELSCGVATTPAADIDALLAAAESAASLMSGHDAGRPARRAIVDATTRSLREALDRDEFVLHYQPIVDLRSGDVRGVEALVRWQHPERGLLPPSEFIGDAEENGLILPLGARVLSQASEQAAAWHRRGLDLTVSVNLSPKQMADPRLLSHVAEVLARTGAPADSLVLEITESSVMDAPSAPQTLAELRALGVRLALDDFGTGYSSLSYLRRFPVDTIKIDRSFVAGMGVDADDDAIVASVVSLARLVEKSVVAEGVEQVEQAAALRALGVPLAQGYLWSRPLPLDELERWLVRRPEVRLTPVGPARRGRGRSDVRARTPEDEERLLQLHAQGASLQTIAAAMNAGGSRTNQDVRWHTRSVAAVVAAALVS